MSVDEFGKEEPTDSSDREEGISAGAPPQTASPRKVELKPVTIVEVQVTEEAIIQAINALAATSIDLYSAGCLKKTLENSSPDVEAISVAKAGDDVVGFLVTTKVDHDDETTSAAFLAVDKQYQRSGVWTRLMLDAMHKMKVSGKRYLTFEYEAPVNRKSTPPVEDRGVMGQFCASFNTKFKISVTDEIANPGRRLFVTATFGLEGVDLNDSKFL